VPANAIDLLQELRGRKPGLLNNIKGFRISGAAAPADAVAELLNLGITVQTGYGMTEAHSHNYTLPGDDSGLVVESSGRTCPGYELKIWSLQDRDIEVANGEQGQIGGKGASLMLGYYEDAQATESAFNAHGWYMTGDIGWIDDTGYLYISGRLKDVINRGGHKIFPARIEQLAERHKDIENAAVIAIRDERLGERIGLVIVPRVGTHPEPQEILEHLHERGLSKYDMPEYIAEIDAMPLTSSGKIAKRSLSTMASNGEINLVTVKSG